MILQAPADAVYYRRDDYASFWRRAVVDVIDVAVAGVLTFVLFAGLWSLPVFHDAAGLLMFVLLVVAFGYFVVLKRSKWRTVGYRAGGVRVVGMEGGTPGWSSLCYRMAFSFLGPLNWVLDLIWLSNDAHRQAIRDKFSHTYVIRATALPAGTGKVAYRYYEICGYNFLFREVEVPARTP